MTEPRNYLAEARAILAGETLLPQREHLEALQEMYECRLIKLLNLTHDFKMQLLEEP